MKILKMKIKKKEKNPLAVTSSGKCMVIGGY
jgi:hypothetical protein